MQEVKYPQVVSSINEKRILMIHRFREEFLNLQLDDYILVFDDGLYNHYLWYKKILAKFKKIQMIFAVSTNIISLDYEIQDDMESPEAHEFYFKYNSKIGFMNLRQIEEISNTYNCFIALHGHDHLHITNLLKEKGLNKTHELMRNEYNQMFMKANDFLVKGIIRSNLMIVLPYNIYSDLFIAVLKKCFNNNNYIGVDLILIGPGRLDIENLIQQTQK